MDMKDAVTATQMVGSVVSTVKSLRDWAKSSGNHELNQRAGDVFDSLNDLRQRVLDLDEENRNLKVELAKRADIDGPVPPHGYYFDKRYPEAPLCPKCYQSKENPRIGYMTTPSAGSFGTSRRCQLCGFSLYEDRSKRGGTQIITRNSWQ